MGQTKSEAVIQSAKDSLSKAITYRYGVVTLSKRKHVVIRTIDNGVADFQVVAEYRSYADAFTHAAKDHGKLMP